MNLFENVTEYMNQCGISDVIKSAPAVLCAYSGGADSSVLLHFLKYFLKNTPEKLYAAHVNHMIRGADADSDEEFCEKTCESLNIRLFHEKINIPKIANETGEGIEECARRERYAYLLSTAASLGAGSVVVTAHNASDNTETVIFNLARGTSVHGLGGISPILRLPRREQGETVALRPLLSVSSRQIRDFAQSEGIPFVTDKTNFDTDYTRNLIRANIVPNLEKINPKVHNAVLRLSQSARTDDEYLANAAERFAGGRKFIPREEFLRLERPVASRTVMLLCERENGRKNITEKNISDCLDLAFSDKNGSISVHGCTFFAHSDAVFVRKNGEADCVDTARDKIPLEIGKFAELNGFLTGVFEKNQDIPPVSENIYNLFIQDVLVRDRIYSNLFVRCRAPGDKFMFHGVNRKLKKLMCERKIPERDRDALPLICDGEKILFVPGIPSEKREAKNGEECLKILIFRKRNLFYEQ